VLNGGSGAGKTTIGRTLQSSLDGTWLLLGIDVFLWTLPPAMFEDAEGIVFEDGVVTRGARFLGLYAQYQLAVATLVAGGADVLLDEVLLGAATDQLRWREALGDNETHWVGLRCGPEIAGAREEARGDRVAGMARQQASSVHEGVHYDLQIDVGVLDVVQSAAAIAQALEERWSIGGLRRSTGPLEPSVPSAFASGGQVRAPHGRAEDPRLSAQPLPIGRVPLGSWPTPLEKASRLGCSLGLGPEDLWIKRDDLSGLGGGGNKVRKLELLCGAALADGADTLVTSGARQSNFARLTAAAGREWASMSSCPGELRS